MWNRVVVASVAVGVACIWADGAETRPEDESGWAVLVKPVDFARFDRPLSPECARSLEILANCLYYNARWCERAFRHDASSGMYVHDDMEEDGIRPSCSVIYALGAALGTKRYDEEKAGIPREEATNRAVQLIRGVVSTHTANGREKGWGDQWQSALWAALMGFGSWMIWDDIDSETQERVASVVVHEADRFLAQGYEVPYWNGEGGNTKAEENSWNAMIHNVAVAMMPAHPNALAWKRIASELMISAYATKSDWRGNTTAVDGRPVKEWLQGYNAMEDGMVMNHGFMHPDYAVSEPMSLWSYLTCSMANVPVSETASHNGALIYRTLNTKSWPSPPCEPPGGTIYKPGEARIYYPYGVDWSTCDVSAYYLTDVWAHLLGWDNGLPTRASEWMRLRAEEMLRMQRRHDDLRMFAAGEYDTYKGSEQWVTWCATDAFLALWLDSQKALRAPSNWLVSD